MIAHRLSHLRLRLSTGVLVGLGLAGAFSARGAHACACNPSRGPTVAHASAHGASLTLRVSRASRGRIDVNEFIKPRHQESFGGGTRLRTEGAFARRGVLLGTSPPLRGRISSLSAVTGQAVTWLAVKGRHHTRTFAPRPAPRNLRRAHPWLPPFRYVAAFVPARFEARRVTAYSARGHVISRARVRDGQAYAALR
jgi:hypothetical protein